jgi:hypothetical protein
MNQHFLCLQNLVDLAGSERAAQTHAIGARLKEGGHINRSLLTLTTVIRKLRSGLVKKIHLYIRSLDQMYLLLVAFSLHYLEIRSLDQMYLLFVAFSLHYLEIIGKLYVYLLDEQSQQVNGHLVPNKFHKRVHSQSVNEMHQLNIFLLCFVLILPISNSFE